METLVWVVQVSLALLVLVSGGMKVVAYDRMKRMAEQRRPGATIPMSRGLAQFVGVAEVIGAVGLVIPQATGILPVLTPLAAAGLAIIMVGAVAKTIRYDSVVLPVLTFAACVVVVIVRGF